MIKKILLPHNFGSNTIWLMLSGLFLRIKAKEDLYGRIKLPDDNYLFNLNSEIINNDYQKFKNLHYVILDGPVEHLQDERIKEVKKNLRSDQTLNFHYVGSFNNYWSSVKNAKPLFTQDYRVFKKVLVEIKKLFPIFFHKYLIKRFAVTVKNIRSCKLSINHIFSKKKYVYYGYIKPNPAHLSNLKNFIKIKNFELNNFFKEIDNYNILKKKISHLCDLKENLLNNTTQKNYAYLNELLLFLIRNILCNFLKKKNNFYIYDNRGSNNLNFNAYEMFFGRQHIYLDLGSKVGYDKIYPRTALLNYLERDTINFSCDESFFFLKKHESNLYLQNKFDSFLKEII